MCQKILLIKFYFRISNHKKQYDFQLYVHFPPHLIHFFLISFLFQISSTEAIWISFGVLALSILISTPFIVISELKIMFLKPGAYDHIAFCAEDLSQWGQVCILGYTL